MAVTSSDSVRVVVVLSVLVVLLGLSKARHQGLQDESGASYVVLHEPENKDFGEFPGILKFGEEKEYLRRHKRENDGGLPNDRPAANETFLEMDYHKYYTSKYLSTGKDLWVDLDNMNRANVLTHNTLSNRHLTAVSEELSFNFPFYGHNLTSVVIATGGFLYMGSFLHKWLTATQYIAPLMGNFNPSINDSATIRYVDTGSSFTCEWNSVHLDDQVQVGSFTFQVSLFKDGKIILAYKNIPLSPNSMRTKDHPVKVGLADAFYVDERLYGSYYRRTIYEYHDVSLNKSWVASNTAFELTPLRTCNQFQRCNSCVEANIDFKCGWCHYVSRCSSGFDRHRQDWLSAGCDEKTGEMKCESKTEVKPHKSSSNTIGVGGIIAIIVLVLVLCGCAGFIIYAYMNPTSRSGLYLISLRYCCRKDTSTSAADDSDKYAVTMDQDGQPIEPASPPPPQEANISHA
ncbi:plexin domain-containing protein 2-like [Glandiceps talaboti]